MLSVRWTFNDSCHYNCLRVSVYNTRVYFSNKRIDFYLEKFSSHNFLFFFYISFSIHFLFIFITFLFFSYFPTYKLYQLVFHTSANQAILHLTFRITFLTGYILCSSQNEVFENHKFCKKLGKYLSIQVDICNTSCSIPRSINIGKLNWQN